MPAHLSVGVQVFNLPDNNVINGTSAAETLTGTADADLINGRGGGDVFLASPGDDLYRGGPGVDSYDGGAGFDRVSFFNEATATHGVVASLLTQTVYDDGYGATEHMTSIEGLGDGTLFPDILIGDNNPNMLIGGKGDILIGLGGDDVFQVDDAPALVEGGSGDNTLLMSGSRYVAPANPASIHPDLDYATHGVTVDLSRHMIVDDGFGGSGLVINVDNVLGTGFGDVLIGDRGENVLYGGAGDDTLTGGAGDDVFLFNQYALGESGIDNGHDVVTDFHGHDKIAIDQPDVTSFADLTIGTDGSGNVTITYGAQHDVITLLGVHHVSASDFIFGPV